MCGIFGVIDKKEKIDLNKVQKSGNLLLHRGPDDEGYLFFNESFSEHQPRLNDSISSPHSFYGLLLHRRLSIIDLSSGHQPLSYSNQDLWITYNGEIYNYRELRDELKSYGLSFSTESDTEVILAAYIKWGTLCTRHFNGMWAFCIYDVKKQVLFCSRDRFGIKPFYYYNDENRFIFSSETKAIPVWINNKINLNTNKIKEYLVKGQVVIGANDETVFNHIRQLLPGHNLIVDIKSLKLTSDQYWDLNINMQYSLKPDQAISEFRELFRDSIRLRLRSDVEVGSCLSGGLDSSSIVSFASREFGVQFNTFTAVWPGTKHDESVYANEVNDKYNCKGHFITADAENILELVDELTNHQEIPIGGSSLFAQWFVMKAAREANVSVLLDGQGADEILSGYPLYLPAYINEIFRSFRWLKFAEDRRDWDYYGYSYLKIFKTLIKNKIYIRNKILPGTDSFLSGYKDSFKYSSSLECNFLPFYLKEHIQKTNLPTLLHYEDRNSMAHSVEARVPFLDYRLVELAVNIPSVYKFKGALTKVILRESMKDYLPEKIYNRRDKIGFSTPIESQLLNNIALKKAMIDMIDKSVIVKEGWIDKMAINDKHIFPLYSLARFIEIFA